MKILSYDPTWRLPEKTLVKIYKSLIRSILDYSSFIINSISNSYRKTLEAIQNNTLRIIFKTTWETTSTSELRQRVKVCSIEDRLNILNEKYFENALLTSNPLVQILIENYLTFRDNINRNSLAAKTILCHHDSIKEYFQHLSQPQLLKTV